MTPFAPFWIFDLCPKWFSSVYINRVIKFDSEYVHRQQLSTLSGSLKSTFSKKNRLLLPLQIFSLCPKWCSSVYLQFGSNQWIQGITYICTERIFACPQFVYVKIFFKKLSYKLVIYIFTLLLTTFASKSAKY